jgi:hypothetical protein
MIKVTTTMSPMPTIQTWRRRSAECAVWVDQRGIVVANPCCPPKSSWQRWRSAVGSTCHPVSVVDRLRATSPRSRTAVGAGDELVKSAGGTRECEAYAAQVSDFTSLGGAGSKSPLSSSCCSMAGGSQRRWSCRLVLMARSPFALALRRVEQQPGYVGAGSTS